MSKQDELVYSVTLKREDSDKGLYGEVRERSMSNGERYIIVQTLFTELNKLLLRPDFFEEMRDIMTEKKGDGV